FQALLLTLLAMQDINLEMSQPIISLMEIDIPDTQYENDLHPSKKKHNTLSYTSLAAPQDPLIISENSTVKSGEPALPHPISQMTSFPTLKSKQGQVPGPPPNPYPNIDADHLSMRKNDSPTSISLDNPEITLTTSEQTADLGSMDIDRDHNEEDALTLPNTADKINVQIKSRGLSDKWQFPIKNQTEILTAVEFLRQNFVIDTVPEFIFQVLLLPPPDWSLFGTRTTNDDTHMQHV
ncbi:2790_t:CDS:2, partial [Gigaspora margarita]